jgi:hypothetical protein
MELIAYRPPPGVWLGIDTAGDDNSPGNVVTPELGAELYEYGVRWVARYTRPDGVVTDNPKPGGDWQGCYSLSISESRDILGAGLAIVPVQFGVFGDVARGNNVGRAMAQTHRLLGFPGGVHHYLDVEGNGPANAGSAACREYIEAAAAAARAGGDSAPAVGLYRTGQVPLTARETYGLKGITAYWRAAGPIPPDPHPRGNAIEQDPPTKVCGILCDTDTMRPDRKGKCPAVVATPEIAAAWDAEALAAALERVHATT